MSYSYRCDVICDECFQAVSGGPQETVDASITEAQNKAFKLKWQYVGRKFLCFYCAKKVLDSGEKTP